MTDAPRSPRKPTVREVFLTRPAAPQTVADLVADLERMGFGVQSRYGELTAWPVTRKELLILPDGIAP